MLWHRGTKSVVGIKLRSLSVASAGVSEPLTALPEWVLGFAAAATHSASVRCTRLVL